MMTDRNETELSQEECMRRHAARIMEDNRKVFDQLDD